MGKIEDLEDHLRDENPRLRAIDLRVFADALITYHEASENIARNGAIVSHPRTGTPIDNPYIKIRALSAASMSKFPRIQCDQSVAKFFVRDETRGE